MSNLHGETTFMPETPMAVWERWSERIHLYHQTYTDKYADLFGKGFVFLDMFGAGPASDAEMLAHDFFIAPGDTTPEHHWTGAREADFVPPGFANTDDTYAMAVAEISGGVDWTPTHFGWSLTWLTVFASGTNRTWFLMALAGRQLCRYGQVRAGMMIEMIFCLDNRGRPVA